MNAIERGGELRGALDGGVSILGSSMLRRARLPIARRLLRTGRVQAVELLQRDPALAELVKRVVKLFAPEQVYLFGSRARGDEGPDSDYDLLVVVPDDATPEQRDSKRFYRYGNCWDLPRGVDVVIWRSTKFANRSRVGASLPATVLREGMLLYAA